MLHLGWRHIQYFFPVWIENISFWTIMPIETYFEKILKCHHNILTEKLFFCQNVFFTFYCNIVCKNIVCDVSLTKIWLIIKGRLHTWCWRHYSRTKIDRSASAFGTRIKFVTIYIKDKFYPPKIRLILHITSSFSHFFHARFSTST